MPTIHITEPLYQFAQILSAQRGEKCKRLGDNTYGSVRGGVEAHLIGVIGELAVAHFFNIPVDTNIYAYGDGGIDLKINDKNIAVKTTTYFSSPKLSVEVNKFRDDCCYFGCALKDRTINLFGWATAEEVAAAEQKRWINKDSAPLNYVLDINEMRQFKADKGYITP